MLLLADTHLGFDGANRARVTRRRRADDFLASYLQVLAAAHSGAVDLVIHAGDLLYRSKVPPALVEQALAPLRALADAGIPVVLLPGNHERSHIPHGLLARHAGLHVIDRPTTVQLTLAGMRVAIAGFPCQRDRVRASFKALLAATRHDEGAADLRLLCLHQCVEGATVGPGDFVFRAGADVIRGAELPAVAAVLSGHIHRHQVLRHDLAGRPLPAPVLYPGSTERSSFAELGEPKGYLLLEFEADDGGGRLAGWRFVELPVRPMLVRSLTRAQLAALDEPALCRKLAELPADAVLQLRIDAEPGADGAALLAPARLRQLAPGMNISLRWRRDRPRAVTGAAALSPSAAARWSPRG